MANNQTPCVIVKAMADYDYIYNVYDYIASGNYDYLKSCNRLQLITITDYNYQNPGLKLITQHVC